MAKAWGAIRLGVSSRKLGKMGKEKPIFMNALINIADQKLLPVPGGVLVRDKIIRPYARPALPVTYQMKMNIVQ
jgi:uncharacterized protein GlcG (DUF336 family)